MRHHVSRMSCVTDLIFGLISLAVAVLGAVLDFPRLLIAMFGIVSGAWLCLAVINGGDL
jgi:hypothetical protein